MELSETGKSFKLPLTKEDILNKEYNLRDLDPGSLSIGDQDGRFQDDDGFDIVIVFPNSTPSDNEERQKIATKIKHKTTKFIPGIGLNVKACRKTIMTCWKLDSYEYHHFLKLDKLQELDEKWIADRSDKDVVSRDEFNVLMREAIIEYLCKSLGLKTYMFKSGDDKELLLKVAFNSSGQIENHAKRLGYMMELNDGYADENFPMAPWMKYSRRKRNEFKNVDTFDQEGLFTDSDRIRILQALLDESLDLPYLAKQKVIKNQYCVHNKMKLESLRDEWGVLKISWDQPLKRVNEYFGSKIALYFAFLEFYTKWITIPAMFGGFWIVIRLVFPDDMEFILDLMAALLIFIWASMLIKFWNRHNSWISAEWGTLDFAKTEPIRPQYEAPLDQDPVTGKLDRIKPTFGSRVWKAFFSGTVTLILISLVISIVTALFWEQQRKDSKWSAEAVGFVNGVQIQVFNYLYYYVAVYLTNWENHRTDSIYENALTLKIFLFQFINCYYSLFWIAFIQPLLDQCQPGECRDYMSQLRIQLIFLFAIDFMLNFVEIGFPLCSFKSRLRGLQANDKRVSASEKQKLLDPYEGILWEYLEIVIEFGYMMLFYVCFPILPIFGLVSTLLEIRVDALKLCYLVQRPHPQIASNIGLWESLLRAMANLAIVTNLGLLIFTSELFSDQPAWIKLCYFLIIENVFLVITYIVDKVIPDTPMYITDLQKRHEILVKERFYALDDRQSLKTQHAKWSSDQLKVHENDILRSL